MTAVLLFALPGVAALLLWLVRPSAATSRSASLAVGGIVLVLGLQLAAATAEGTVLVHAFGGWRPPYGIAFAADRLSALFAVLHAVLLLVTLLALRPGAHGETVVQRAHPLLLMLSLGLFGGFLTGDLFDLFVMFELVLVTSYLLLQVPGTRRSLAGTIPAVVVNLVASAIFLAGLGLLYGFAGSVNVADLAGALGEVPETPRRVALGMLVVAFATKAAVVPLCFWMPATYPTLSAPLAALFAGIMTKLGVYALLRVLPLVAIDPLLTDVLLWAGGVSALLGVLAALSQYELRRLLAFHSVSQVGFMVLALGLGSPAGVAASIFFALHHSLVKSALYLVADELERRNASRDLRRMDFRLASDTALAVCFGVAAFSLAGMPPFSGFFGKVGVFQAAVASGAWAGLALLVGASVFTLASMLKIWRFAFQRTPGGAPEPAPAAGSGSGALVAMLGLILALGFAAGPVQDYSAATALALLDGSAYAEAMSGAPGLPVRPDEVP
ncbi:MAG: proton-conducting transporter membrane subunit [Myxococcota bacterium]|nr:proton-conducting transporter membrane subunit [Myxococcota bacterium]